MQLKEKNFSSNPILKQADEYMKRNMPKEALNTYLKSIMAEKDIKSYVGASKAYRELKEYDKAIKHLKKAKQISSFDYEIYFELGLNHLLNSDFELANKNFRKTIKLNPDFINAQIQLAISHELMDEPLMAHQIYDKIIEENKECILAYHHKAGLLISLKDFNGAIKTFFEILKIDEEYEKAYLGIGICFDKLEKYTNAVRFYKKYIEKNPKSNTAKSIASRIVDIVSATTITNNHNLRVLK